MSNSTTSAISFTPGPPNPSVVASAVFIIVSCLIVVVNFVTIFTFVINRHLRRRSVYCLLNLAVADMLFGCISIINQIYISSVPEIFTIFLFYYFFFIASLSCLTLVSVERVYAIFFPLRHRTTRMYIAGFIISWIVPVPELIPMDYTNEHTANERDIFILAAYLTCLLIICISYTAIFIKVMIQAKRLRPIQQQIAAIRQKREQHLAMTLMIVTGFSLMAWLPYTSVAMRLLLSSNYSAEFYNSIAVQMTLLIQNLNSLINPIIYVFRMKDFRRALARLLRCSRDQHIYPMCVYLGNHGNHNRRHEAGVQEMHRMSTYETPQGTTLNRATRL